MPFEIGEVGIREFVYDADGPAFLKTELVRFVWIGTDTSEFIIVHVEQWPYMHFESNWPISSMLKKHYTLYIEVGMPGPLFNHAFSCKLYKLYN